MPSFNKVILIGHLTRDPELRYTPKGTAVCKIGLAVNRVWTNEAGEKKEEVTFVDVDLFGRTAENVGQYMRKGRPIMIEGRLVLNQWETKDTGEKRSKLSVTADHVQFLGSNDNARSETAPAKSTTKQAADQSSPASETAPENPGDDSDVPF